MQLFISLLFLLGIPSVAPETHSLQYFFTASSGVQGFPQFVAVGMVDGFQIDYYDSNIRRAIPKQEWMAQSEGPEYWERNTQIYIGQEQVNINNIETVKQRFNQTGGVHLFQWMYGCEWDDETGEVNGFDQHGFDGEDYIVLDLKTETWIAPVPQAVPSKLKLENDRGLMAYLKNYFTQICPESLKKYVKSGEKSLKRKVLPSVSLLQKTSSSPVTCHATGFYPDRADLFWQRDEEELHEEVVRGEILPNPDGSFQTSVDLDLSGVADEDWSRYSCVFHLAGAPEDVVTKLDKDAVRSNRKKPPPEGFPTAAVVGGVFGGVVGLLILAAIMGVIIRRTKSDGFKRTNTSETSSSSGHPAVNTVSPSSETSRSLQHSSPLQESSEEHSMLPPTA